MMGDVFPFHIMNRKMSSPRENLESIRIFLLKLIIIIYKEIINHLKLSVACIYVCRVVDAEEARSPSDPEEGRSNLLPVIIL